MSASLKGIAASDGIAFGSAYLLKEPDLSFDKTPIKNSKEEISRLHTALKRAEQELKNIRRKVSQEQGEENAAIFDSHMLILNDPELIIAIEERIKTDLINAETALQD